MLLKSDGNVRSSQMLLYWFLRKWFKWIMGKYDGWGSDRYRYSFHVYWLRFW